MQQSQPSLPSNRAFVVQFRSQPGDARGQQVGRVEHVVSGQAVHFYSWEALQWFIEQTLANVNKKLP